ncbi:cbb3-type cytochrome oxidase subunit 3 [Porticoccus sp.]
MDQGTLQGIGTVLTLIAFLGVCWWAYSGRNKKGFEEASKLPFADEQSPSREDERSSSQEDEQPTSQQKDK